MEDAFLFECEGAQLLGILHAADEPTSDLGIVLVVGGPQYRVGSHRQFVLLARDLARTGFPVLRFDYRGMGDSEGEFRDFEKVDRDIAAAIDAMAERLPDIQRFVLWGLCDAATANAFYALNDARVVGQVAANPWVRTEEGEAQAFIRHYYLKRVLSKDFWGKVIGLRFDALGAGRDFLAKLGQSRGRGDARTAQRDQRPLPVRLNEAQTSFNGKTLLLISGQDLTAKEYLNRVSESPTWQKWLGSPSVMVHTLDEADHTFSSAAWRDQVAEWTSAWLRRL